MSIMILRKKVFIALAICFVNLVAYAQEKSSQDPFHYYNLAMKAYAERNYTSYLENLSLVVGPDTKNPALLYQMAGAQALAGNRKEAISWLDKISKMGLAYPIDTSADFSSLRNLDTFKKISADFKRNSTAVTNSTLAFTLAEKDLIPEGIAYDPVSQRFFVSSIYKHKVISIDKTGAVKNFTEEKQDGLWSVLGMKADAERRILWVCSFTSPTTRDTTMKGYSGIFKYDLQSNKLIKKYVLDNKKQTHLLNDLAIDSKGQVYVTDSEAGAIYAISPETDSLALFIQSSQLIYPNGIALSADEKKIFVAHFNGISIINLQNKAIVPLLHPSTISTAGIDGLYLYQNSLVAVQNFVFPNRIIQFHLNPASDQIASAMVLEANNPLFKIPTTGTIANGSFFYIANSQLRSLKEDGTVPPLNQLQETSILKVKLR